MGGPTISQSVPGIAWSVRSTMTKPPSRPLSLATMTARCGWFSVSRGAFGDGADVSAEASAKADAAVLRDLLQLEVPAIERVPDRRGDKSVQASKSDSMPRAHRSCAASIIRLELLRIEPHDDDRWRLARREPEWAGKQGRPAECFLGNSGSVGNSGSEWNFLKRLRPRRRMPIQATKPSPHPLLPRLRPC